MIFFSLQFFTPFFWSWRSCELLSATKFCDARRCKPPATPRSSGVGTPTWAAAGRYIQTNASCGRANRWVASLAPTKCEDLVWEFEEQSQIPRLWAVLFLKWKPNGISQRNDHIQQSIRSSNAVAGAGFATVPTVPTVPSAMAQRCLLRWVKSGFPLVFGWG